jgi:FkbM family methyltransferase
LFAAIAAKIVGDKGMVFAFEPTPATQVLLRKTIAINKMNHIVEPVAKAVSNAEGTIIFYASEHEGDNSNSLVSYKNDRELKGIEVPLTSVDIFVKQKQLSAVNFIKIDVEGAEYDAIRGAANTILTYKPAIILALHPLAISAKGDTLAGIYDFVISCNYTILLNDKKISKNDFCAATELFDVHLLPIK